MNEYQKKLVEQLLEKNNFISVGQAKTWVQLLWNDFENNNEKTDYEETEKIVSQWINLYGAKIHEYVSSTLNYSGIVDGNKNLLH